VKCDKCNGTGHIGNPVRDRFNQPVEFTDMILAMTPRWDVDYKGHKTSFEFTPILLIQNERCVDLAKGTWEIDAWAYYEGSRERFTFSGEIDKPCPDFITLNKTVEDMRVEGEI